MINLGQSVFLKNRTRKTVLKLPSSLEYIRKASSKVLKALSSLDVDGDTLFDIRLCVEEAVRNAIVHGNRSDKSRFVRVAYWIKDDKLSVEVEDEGGGFIHGDVADPTADDNIMKNSGRGVFLIKKLMDLVEYNDTGNKIKMVKYL
ncbi:MAG: ATP-binding protein [Candidatus Omnitrophota bacterium]